MKLISVLIFILISMRVSAGAYPLDFPEVSCDEYWNEAGINGEYQSGEDYKSFYRSLDRKNCYKDWTVLIFMAADNDLSPYAL